MPEHGTASCYANVAERLRSHDEIYGIEGKGLSLYLLREFLSQEECATLIGLIDSKNYPSKVMGETGDKYYRTSRSSALAYSGHPLISVVDRRIASLIGIRRSQQEGIEGQRYMPGEQFKPHLDTFPTDQPYWPEQSRVGGQRTWTVMIYLNQPEAGGGTMFPRAGVRLKPRAGNLLAWCNLDAHGAVNLNSLHCGEPVETGVKYVLTKWHRERRLTPHLRHVSDLTPAAA